MKTIIYGVGLVLEEYLLCSDRDLTDVVAFVDKSKEKQGIIIDGIKVISPLDMTQIQYDEVRIASEMYYSEIKAELIELGCIENKIKKLEYKKDKYSGELAYWKVKFREDKGYFKNGGYKDIFMGIAEEDNEDFLENRIIADFGCGPRGSLAWTTKPKVKIGIDVLANAYMRHFGECMTKHGMIYLNSDEYKVPLPDDYLDVISTINSLDHVDVLDNMVNEICRILKPGGLFLGSFNLNEPVTQCEPQTLTEELLYDKLLYKFNVLSKRISEKGLVDTYSNLREGRCVDRLPDGVPGEMWVKAILK